MYFVGNSSTAKLLGLLIFFFTADNYCTCQITIPPFTRGNSLFLIKTNGDCSKNSCKNILDFLAISHSLYHPTGDHWSVGGHARYEIRDH